MVISEPVRSRARRIRMVVTDCDGVLTDGGVYYSARGEEMKRFFIRDGMGVRLLRERANIDTGIITGELSESVRRRAEKLKITELHLGIQDKVSVLLEIGFRRELPPEAIAYIGDDVNDLEILKRVGLSACPGDAIDEVKQVVDVVCRASGGHGAFRELAELILLAQAEVPGPVTGSES